MTVSSRITLTLWFQYTTRRGIWLVISFLLYQITISEIHSPLHQIDFLFPSLLDDDFQDSLASSSDKFPFSISTR